MAETQLIFLAVQWTMTKTYAESFRAKSLEKLSDDTDIKHFQPKNFRFKNGWML